jgi:hypothetical protein
MELLGGVVVWTKALFTEMLCSKDADGTRASRARLEHYEMVRGM